MWFTWLVSLDTYEFETSWSNSYILPPVSLIMSLLFAKSAIVLIMIVILVPVIFMSMVLLDLTNTLEIMNEQQIEFANKTREYDLSHKIDVRFSSPRLNVNLCDDAMSFPPLEFGLREVLDPPWLLYPLLFHPYIIRLGTTLLLTWPFLIHFSI